MKNFTKPFVIFMALALMILVACQKDDQVGDEGFENHKVESINAFYLSSSEVPFHILEYIKSETNNAFEVQIEKRNIRLSGHGPSEFGKETAMGTVETDRVVQVFNEQNTKYTFRVSNLADTSSIVNLVVVDFEGVIMEYFIQYVFDPNVSQALLPSGGIDMSRFTGGMVFYKQDGSPIGDFILDDGAVVDGEGTTDPCEDDEDFWDWYEDWLEDNDNGDNQSGGGAEGGSDPGGDGGSNSDGGDIGSSGAGEFFNPDDCGLDILYGDCGCGELGENDGHDKNPDSHCCNGSPTTLYNSCNGASYTFNRAGGNPDDSGESPCDGAVGVLLPEDNCNVSNETFNAIYNNNSPFSVDLSEIREDCEGGTSIDTSLVAANQKFMCIYNKLVNSPNFKNLFIDTFGESENLNAKFELVDDLTYQSEPVNGLASLENYSSDTEGNITEIEVKIKINANMLKPGTEAKTPMQIVKTIIHECIHTYLYVKILNCDLGTEVSLLTNTLLTELLEDFYDDTCQPAQDSHDFMFNYMLPTMASILDDIKDDILPLNQQESLIGYDYYQLSQSTNGPLTESEVFNWPNFYYYLSLTGLHNSNAYINSNTPNREFLMNAYMADLTLLSKNCYE